MLENMTVLTGYVLKWQMEDLWDQLNVSSMIEGTLLCTEPYLGVDQNPAYNSFSATAEQGMNIAIPVDTALSFM